MIIKKENWQGWQLDAEHKTLTHENDLTYQVDLETMTTRDEIADWIFHLYTRPDHVGTIEGLVNAIGAILEPHGPGAIDPKAKVKSYALQLLTSE